MTSSLSTSCCCRLCVRASNCARAFSCSNLTVSCGPHDDRNAVWPSARTGAPVNGWRLEAASAPRVRRTAPARVRPAWHPGPAPLIPTKSAPRSALPPARPAPPPAPPARAAACWPQPARAPAPRDATCAVPPAPGSPPLARTALRVPALRPPASYPSHASALSRLPAAAHPPEPLEFAPGRESSRPNGHRAGRRRPDR